MFINYLSGQQKQIRCLTVMRITGLIEHAKVSLEIERAKVSLETRG